MFLPTEYLWLEPVLIASIVVFLVDLVGNTIAFGNRFINALVTAILFGVLFGVLIYFGYGDLQVSVSTPTTN